MKQYSNLNILMTSNNLVHMMYGFDYGFFRPHIIALTGSKASHNTRECITRHLVKQYSYNRLDFNAYTEPDCKYNTKPKIQGQQLIQRMQLTHNKRFVISDLLHYHEYQELAPYDPFIIRVDDNNNEEYKKIPYNIKIVDCGRVDEKHILRKLNIEFQNLSK